MGLLIDNCFTFHLMPLIVYATVRKRSDCLFGSWTIIGDPINVTNNTCILLQFKTALPLGSKREPYSEVNFIFYYSKAIRSEVEV